MEEKREDIIEVAEVSGSDEANKYLKLGWVLLNTVAVNSPEEEGSYICYALGWSKNSGKPKRPASNDVPFLI